MRKSLIIMRKTAVIVPKTAIIMLPKIILINNIRKSLMGANFSDQASIKRGTTLHISLINVPYFPSDAAAFSVLSFLRLTILTLNQTAKDTTPTTKAMPP